ncbi:MAG: hypothetical protein J6X58_03075 [Bacteroidales bacterium]|nr:hypothetical protein [Bacteroidales bacterium]
MHINFTGILYIIIGLLFWKVFPGIVGKGGASDIINTVFKILGILLVVVGTFVFVVSLF